MARSILKLTNLNQLLMECLRNSINPSLFTSVYYFWAFRLFKLRDSNQLPRRSEIPPQICESVTQSESSWEGYRVCTLPVGIWARTMDQTLSLCYFWGPKRSRTDSGPVDSPSSKKSAEFDRCWLKLGNRSNWIFRCSDRAGNLKKQQTTTLWGYTQRISKNVE